MKVIMENWRRVLKEDFAGEEDWNQGFDSDFGGKYDPKKGGVKIQGFTLIILNSGFLEKEYPNLAGKNHGMVSHAIKHAAEFFDLSKDVKVFKDNIEKIYNGGKDLYIRFNEGQAIKTYKINKKIVDSIDQFNEGLMELFVANGYDRKKMSDKAYREQWNAKKPTLEGMFVKENPDLVNEITSLYIEDKPKEINSKVITNTAKIGSAIMKRIKKLGRKEFLVFLDFYYDLNRLDLVDAFDGEMVNKYKEIVDEFIEKGEFAQDPNDKEKSILTAPSKGGTVVIIKRNNKISSAMKVKGNVSPEKYFRK